MRTAAPDGLQGALDAVRPAAFPSSFVLHAVETKDALARKMVWSIYQHRLPAIALTSGRSHWLVVRGFEASAFPTSASDTLYTIASLDIHNPSPIPGSPPPPHNAADLCGTGGDRGLAEEHVSYTHWLAAYLWPVGSPSQWEGKFLTIGDPDLPPTSPGKQPPPAQREKGEQIISPDKARASALAGIRQAGLDKREGWGGSLVGTKPGTPLLVQRLDRLDTFYYIVPLQTDTATPVLVCVDARFGNYQQAGRTKSPGDDALGGLNFNAQWAATQFLGRRFELGRRGRLTVRKEGFSLYPTLVWKPCRESSSAYLPFFMAIIGNRRIYLRVDGQFFLNLHTGDWGN